MERTLSSSARVVKIARSHGHDACPEYEHTFPPKCRQRSHRRETLRLLGLLRLRATATTRRFLLTVACLTRLALSLFAFGRVVARVLLFAREFRRLRVEPQFAFGVLAQPENLPSMLDDRRFFARLLRHF